MHNYGVYVMYNDDDHDLIYDGERSWKYPSHQQATDRVWSHQFVATLFRRQQEDYCIREQGTATPPCWYNDQIDDFKPYL
jgi:hypothetical protein